MDFNELIESFKRNSKQKDKKATDSATLHSARATVRHTSPFSELEHYKNEEELTQEFIEEWVFPYYMRVKEYSDEWIEEIIALKLQITDEVILKNLGKTNWRNRAVGSYFALITQANYAEDIIGVHLLKSEVCCVGHTFASVLAMFNTEKSVMYLSKYLNYYLKQPELNFDQEEVMEALKYLDEINGTNNVDNHLEDWYYYLNWKHNYTFRELLNRKQNDPDKAEEIDKQLNEIQPLKPEIDTAYLKRYRQVVNRIIKG